MTISTHIDSVNGEPLLVVLNAPYQTIENGSHFVKGQSVRKFCEESGSAYAKVVGSQVWASQYPGLLLFAYIDDNLHRWGLNAEDAIVYIPLDSSIYSVEVGSLGACVVGTERISSYNDHIQQQSPLKSFYLAGGSLSDRFDDVQAINPLTDLAAYQFSTVNRECIKNRYFTAPHYIGVVIAAGLLTAALMFALGEMNSVQVPELVPVVRAGAQKGNDLAVSQFLYLADIIDQDLHYFQTKGITTFTYSIDGGVSIAGEYPPYESLLKLVTDTDRSNIPLYFSAEGWSVFKHPSIPLRPQFDLPPFNQVFLVTKLLEEKFALQGAHDAAISQSGRTTMKVSFQKELVGKPRLRELAKELEGFPVAINSLSIGFARNQFQFISMTLTISGERI